MASAGAGARGIGARVEGVRAVIAALDAGRVVELRVERGRRDLDSLAERARACGATVRVTSSLDGWAATGSPQGVAAEARPIPRARLEDLLTGRPALLVLDHLQDPRNAGAAARSALAAGMTGLVAPARRATPFSTAAFKAAAGALETLPVAEVSSVAEAAALMGRAGVWTVGLDAGAERPLFGLEIFTEPVAIFAGAEGKGLGRLVRQRMDLMVSIPANPDFPSLNAATAAALACFELRRARLSSPF